MMAMEISRKVQESSLQWYRHDKSHWAGDLRKPKWRWMDCVKEEESCQTLTSHRSGEKSRWRPFRHEGLLREPICSSWWPRLPTEVPGWTDAWSTAVGHSSYPSNVLSWRKKCWKARWWPSPHGTAGRQEGDCHSIYHDSVPRGWHQNRLTDTDLTSNFQSYSQAAFPSMTNRMMDDNECWLLCTTALAYMYHYRAAMYSLPFLYGCWWYIAARDGT